MSPYGTKREFSPERLKGREPPHNGPSGLNVGSPLHSRPKSEGCRRSVHDPKPTFEGVTGTSLSRNVSMIVGSLSKVPISMVLLSPEMASG